MTATNEMGPYPTFYTGVVKDRSDPLGLGRVRIEIPNVTPLSNWAWPMGTLGGGSDGRGAYFVPELDAEVSVFFKQGELEYPHYLCGNWGMPSTAEGGTEVPDVLKIIPPEERPDVRVLSSKRYVIIMDDRKDQEYLVIRDKETGDLIGLDGVKRTITLNAETGIVIKTDGLVDISGAQVQINGRVVATSKRQL